HQTFCLHAVGGDMDPNTLRERFAEARVARLATVTADERPHLVPCCFALVDDRIVTAVDGKPKSTLALRRLENVRSHPAASLLVDQYDDDWSQLWWIRVDGQSRVVESGAERDAAVATLVEKYHQYQHVPILGAVIVIERLRWRAWP